MKHSIQILITLTVALFTAAASSYAQTRREQVAGRTQVYTQVAKELAPYLGRPFYITQYDMYGRCVLEANFSDNYIQIDSTFVTYQKKLLPILSIEDGRLTGQKRLELSSSGDVLVMNINFKNIDSGTVTCSFTHAKANAAGRLLAARILLLDSKYIALESNTYVSKISNVLFYSDIYSADIETICNKYLRDEKAHKSATQIFSATDYIHYKYGRHTSVQRSFEHDFNGDGIEDKVLLILPHEITYLATNMTKQKNDLKLIYLQSNANKYYQVRAELYVKVDMKDGYYTLKSNFDKTKIQLQVENRLKHEVRTYTWYWSKKEDDWIPEGIVTNIPKFQDCLMEEKRMKPLSHTYKFEPYRYYINSNQPDDLSF